MTTGSVDKPFMTSSKNVEEFGTPLRRFKGKLQPINPPQPEQNRKYPSVKLQFTNVEILPFPDGSPGSVSPYPYPVAELSLAYITTQSGNLGNIGWGGLLKTLEDNCHEHDLQAQAGKMLLLEGKMEAYTDRTTKEERSTLRWSIIQIEGQGPKLSEADELAYMVALADGKDETEFATAAFTDSIGRKYNDTILNGTFLSSLVNANKLTRDSVGKYHKV